VITRISILSMAVLAAAAAGGTRGLASETAAAAPPPPLAVTFQTVTYPGGSSTKVFGINDAETIVGSYFTAGHEAGFIRTKGQVWTSIVYPGTDVTRTQLLGINNTGQIVGCYYTVTVPYGCYSGFLLSGGVFTQISYPGAAITMPTGINDAGDIVGWTGTPARGFLLRDGVFTTFEYPSAASTYASGLGPEPNPTVVGSFAASLGSQHRGYVRKDGTFTLIEYPDATWTTANGVNAAGQVAGTFAIEGNPRVSGGYLLTAGELATIDLPNGDSGIGGVYGLNNSNQIVGERYDGIIDRWGFVGTFSGTPRLAHAAPDHGSPGQAGLNILVTGAFSHFAQGTTTAAFGAGITVNAVTVHNPNQATVNVTIAPGATLGSRTITLTTGSEVVSLTDGFAVTNEGAPTLTHIWPATAPHGSTNLDVMVAADFTHFVQGTTTANLGGGITVNSVTVQSATQATVNVTISNTATQGARTVRLITGSEAVSVAGGFTVTGPPALTSATPSMLRRLETNVPVLLTGQFTRFAQGTTSVSFGDGITVNSIIVHSPTLATAYVTVSGTTRFGHRDVTVTSDYEVVERSDAVWVRVTDARGNFWGDFGAELSMYSLPSGTWRVMNDMPLDWGAPDDVPLLADINGDGFTEPTVYRPSTGGWFIFAGSYSFWFGFTWGISGDVPVPADYDGDGATDVAVYRPSTGHWFVLTSASNFSSSITYGWGLPGDVPVPGDYDGDVKADVAVFRPSTGTWFVLNSGAGSTTWSVHQWGTNGDIPVAADFDGDSVTDVAVYRPDAGSWFILTSSSGFTSAATYQWGIAGDVPVPADFDDDGKADPAVYRPSTRTWFILESRFGYRQRASEFGQPGEIPILGRD
jgi:hypothetical protein